MGAVFIVHRIDFMLQTFSIIGKLRKEVCMEQPSELEQIRLVCSLKKSLYDLKKSPQGSFNRFSSVVIEYGMQWCRLGVLLSQRKYVLICRLT